jgi:hypothetical protein
MSWASNKSIGRMCLFHLFAGTVEQVRELPELFRGKVAPLAAMQLVHGLIQFDQQPEPFLGDASLDHATVLRFPRAGDPSAGFHPVEQASDVRIARDEPAADLAAGQALLAGTAKDTQDVVLRPGKAVGLKQGFCATGQGVGRPHEADENVGFEGGLGSEFPFHEPTILVITTIVKRNIAGGFLCARRLLSVSLVLKVFLFQTAKP